MTTAGDVIQWVSALGVFAFLGTLVTILANKRKIKSDTASVLTASALSLLEPMKKELAELNKEVIEARSEVAEFRSLVRKLLIELSQHRELTTGEQQIIRGY